MKLGFMQKAKPGVLLVWLYVVAGLMWSGVGMMLSEFAYGWLAPLPFSKAILFGLAGLTLAVCIHLFGFSRFASKNLARLSKYARENVCIFAFQAWTSYPMVIFMIGLGIFLRKYSPIPKSVLAVLYLGIGGGLFMSSFLYHQQWYGMIRERNR